MKKAFITGVTGQDGSYLAELLLDKGYAVHGLYRRSSTNNLSRILPAMQKYKGSFFLHSGDMTDGARLSQLIHDIKPNEIYNLAGQSQVGIAFFNPVYTLDSIAMGTTALLQAIRDYVPHARFYQSSSSEMFGNSPAPQNEDTALQARSPYGAAKIAAHQMVRVFREAYGLFACCGILFNHESPRRGDEFVTKKIAKGIARIKISGDSNPIPLGNLHAKRDWGFAGDYVEAMWMMLQADIPEDFVVSTGETHTVEEFLKVCVLTVNLPWGHAHHYSINDPTLFRPAEVNQLLGDSSKITKKLGWKPRIKFDKLAEMMVLSELENISKLY